MKSFYRNGFKVKLWSYDDIQLENIETCDANYVDKNNLRKGSFLDMLYSK